MLRTGSGGGSFDVAMLMGANMGFADVEELVDLKKSIQVLSMKYCSNG